MSAPDTEPADPAESTPTADPATPEVEASAEITFADFGLDPRLQDAIAAMGFEAPTPIQAAALPPLLEGRDVIGRARTGSGKTAAFGLPLLQRISVDGLGVRALVLAPTRELALQVTAAIREYGADLPFLALTVYGGASYGPQLRGLRDGASVVVGTPGRLLDLVDRGALDLGDVELLVLDEADEMLRMGFIDEVERIFEATPDDRQVALFSATMPPQIQRVAEAHLRHPVTIQVESQALTVDHIEQRWMEVPQKAKLDALIRILAAEEREGTLIFARTRAGCAEVADALGAQGIDADALHGDLNQAARERVLARLRSRRLDVLVATDVAARGLDVEHITHVINLDLPDDAETYVHRIGRTGRAGRDGVAISFVTTRQYRRLKSFERVLKTSIQQSRPPSDVEIRGARRGALRRELMGALERDQADRGEASEAAEVGAAGLLRALEGDGMDARSAAIAALRILAEERRLDLGPPPAERPPSWSRQAPRGERHVPGPDVSEGAIFLATGHSRGVRPGDVVGALANDLGIPGNQIGRIEIQHRKSFVWMPAPVVDQVLREHQKLLIRGRPTPIARARFQPPPEDGPRRYPKKKGWQGKKRRD